MILPPPTSTLFPYTTLFRSEIIASPDAEHLITTLLRKVGHPCRVIKHERLSPLTVAPRPWRIENPERSEEHTSELQSQFHLVCRLLLEKKKKITIPKPHHKN